MKIVLTVLCAALLLTALGWNMASAQQRRPEQGGQRPPANGERFESPGRQRPSLIIRGKGGKITDVERRGGSSFQPGEERPHDRSRPHPRQ